VKPTTEASYADMTRRHIVTRLGHLYLAKLSRDDVRRFIRQLARTKSQRRGDDRVLSARTVQYVRSILRRALEDARREELIGRNVAREVSLPRYERREFEPLSPKEARALLAAAADDRLYAAYVLALLLDFSKGPVPRPATQLRVAAVRARSAVADGDGDPRALPDQHYVGHLHARHAGAVPRGRRRPGCVSRW
jgi:hypothetical protein